MYLELAGLRYDSFEVDGIDQRLPERHLFDAAIVKAVDVIPD